MITPRDVDILSALALYYVLNRQQIQRLLFPNDPTGRMTRRRLQFLVSAGLINRHKLFAFNPLLSAPAPVYYPSRKGAEFLAAHFDDDRFLATCTQQPQANNILHWLAVSDTHITLTEATSLQHEVQLQGFLNEWDTVNKEETRPEKRYRLYTLIREQPRLVCAPDGAFQLATSDGKFRKVFYLEQDRETSGVHQIAASKTLGYAAMAEQNLHHRHFPETNIDPFTVLLITPGKGRRDALRRTIKAKPGADLWRFAVTSDATTENFLFSPIWYPCEGEPTAIVKKQSVVNDKCPPALPRP